MASRLVLLVLLIMAAAWAAAYSSHFNTVDASVIELLRSPTDLQQSVDNFERHIAPILVEKCSACHTDTNERPFFYYIPGIQSISRPYTDSRIERARNHFDLSDGLITGRLGGTFEAVARLIEITKSRTMPPIEYALVRPHMLLAIDEVEAISTWANATGALIMQELVASSGGGERADAAEETKPFNDFGPAMAAELIAACPIAAPDDLTAREACADALVASDILRNRMNNPFMWGGQSEVGEYRPYHSEINRFSPLLWKKYYMSLFMFEGDYVVEKQNELTAYRFPVRFRAALGDGEYPYPFWHSEEKWRRYNVSSELIILVQAGKIIGSLRSAASRPSPHSWSKRIWNGEWLWSDEHQAPQPRVTNFDTLLTGTNPYLDELDAAYQNLALKFRDENCLSCHNPENSAGMKTLEILSSPAHALAARRRLESVLAANAMPPGEGIESPVERENIANIARDFRRIGDQAMGYEREILQDALDRPAIQPAK